MIAGADYSVSEFSLQGGFVRGTLLIPNSAADSAPRAVVINPLIAQGRLLARGVAVARYHVEWSVLAAFKPPPASETPERKQRPKNTVGVWLLASPSADVIGKGYFALIWSEGAVAKRVVEHLATLPAIDDDRVGMSGISTNGFKVFSALMAGARLQAAVVAGASADYHCFLANSPLALGGADLSLESSYETWLQEREPVLHVDRFAKTALLMVNGGRDHVIPSGCVEGAVPTIREAYARAKEPDRFRLSWWPDATHNELVGVAEEDILAWWLQWLGTPGGTRD